MPQTDENRMLPAPPGNANLPVTTTPPPTTAASQPPIVATMPARQLQDMPKDELYTLAEDFGLEPDNYPTPQHLVAAIHERRHLINSLDRDAMLDVVKWGRRPLPINATKETIAREIIQLKSMRFDGLSQRGLIVLAALRGVTLDEKDAVPAIVKKLKKKEGFFARLNRKRRRMLGSLVSKVMGEDPAGSDYQFLPPQEGGTTTTGSAKPQEGPRPSSMREEIEESGLFGGIAGRIKRSADSYVNQKLDEIESRIDRKLDEIDRRLGEWRDKEIANRIRILKITLWASVIVGVVSLIYSYVKVYWIGK
jgi:hypothetical protein